MLTLKEWLQRYGSEPCNGCRFNIAHRAKCTYKSGCVRYDNYREDERRKKPRQLKLF